MAQPVLDTARLRLRPRTLDDLEDCFRMDREPGTLDYIDWPNKTGTWDSSTAHRAHIRNRTTFPYPPGMGYWIVSPRTTPDDFLGWVEMIPEDTEGPLIEIGWRLRTAARGNGYATEAARAILAHGFGTLGIGCVTADMHRANAASMGVACRLGMRERADPERTTEKYVLWELTRAMWSEGT